MKIGQSIREMSVDTFAKIFLALLMIFGILSCQPKTVVIEKIVTPGSTPIIQNALETIPKRYVDTEKGVVCYITSCDISCVKE